MERDSQSLREDLYRVIQHYADLAALAKKGEINPLGQIGKILKNTAPYLLLVIKDYLPQLERHEITFYEMLFQIISEAQRFPDQQVLLDSRNEIQKAEHAGRIFLYAVKWLDAQSNLRPSLQDIDVMAQKLQGLNDKYKKRYCFIDEETTTLIPCFFLREETESHENSLGRLADLVRRAILELHHLMIDHEPERKSFLSIFRTTNHAREEAENDLVQLAWFLFRCGFPVNRIATGYYKDALSNFLNERILIHLAKTAKSLDTIQGISNHLWLTCLMEFSTFFEIANDYVDLNDAKEVNKHIKIIKGRNRRGGNLLERIIELLQIYADHPNGKLPASFLLYRYYASFGDYHGDRRLDDRTRALKAVELYKPLLDRSEIEKKAAEGLQESGKCFSSKTQDEMAGLFKLIMDSLENPASIKGKKVKVLGDISSGAMGSVSVGIYRNQIVALKRVRSQISSALGDPEALLDYESKIHARVQLPEPHACVVDYYGLIEQDNEKIMVNGYHPNDNLTQLVERNWLEKYKPPFNVESKLNLAVLEIIVNQLLDCLRFFRLKGVVHRDLKTDNILYMVDENERLNRIKVIDFGVALAIGPGAIEDLFRGKVVGTFAYMAPEQAKGKSVFQSDLYSVGAIFTVLLTGKLPMVFPKTKTRQDLVRQILRIEKEPRPRLTELNPFLKKNTTLEHIAATVESMLDLDPMRRPNLEEVQEAFDGVFQHIGQEKHTLSIYYHRG
ncbi:serine/threonine protein kinase [Desulfomonile tiedjei]|uniref:Serine/threonine protein kinase n=1 Tax=Desulfomonile tiedjei (strain ATCC 49306 / DSM 6799 / DCB-1) TaxID=706587 RepID=I4CAB9_DESTA|nr:protein kinase [Desulfomonile tiedjei]AFM26510.1 serine/threonine protein kinase [Desulfomonile tiedjei DSM 6799]